MIWGQKGNNLCKRDIPDGHSRCTGAMSNPHAQNFWKYLGA